MTHIVAWALFVTVHVPGFPGTPEPVEAIALLSKAVELLGILLMLPLVRWRMHLVDHHSERTQPEDLGVELLGTGGVRVHEFALLEALFDLLVAVQPDPLAGIDRLLGSHNTWRAILEPEI